MKRILFLSALGVSAFSVFLAFSSSTVQAKEGPYVGAKFGWSILSDSNLAGSDGYSRKFSYDNGFGLDVAVGYKFTMFRLEGEAVYFANDLNEYSDRDGSGEANGDVKHLSGMANAYFDFDNASLVTPYAGAGIGVARVDLSANTFSWDDSDTVFAYQFIGGANFALTPQFSIDAEYRYFGTQDPEFDHDDGSIKAEIESHNLMVGLRFTF